VRIAEAAIAWVPSGWTEHLLPSLGRLLVGYLIAITVGIVCGLAIGMNRVLYRMFMPTIDFLRSVPKPALIPPLVLLFGLGSFSRVLIVALGAVWPVLIATIDGARGRDERYGDIARVFQVSGVRRLLRVELPAASPHILAGMRVGISLAVFMLIVGEMFASTSGLGYYVLHSQRSFDLAGMWAGTVIAGLLGFLLSYGFEAIERRVLFWKGDLNTGIVVARQRRRERKPARV
jgi:ABC-type nitrate/sulfonate/bicarbonate transport system permease component